MRRPRASTARSCAVRRAERASIGIVTYVTLLERKFAARMQSRIGPYRVGPARAAAADRRRAQADDEGGHRPDGGRPAGLQPGADRLPRPVHADLRDDPVRARARRGRPQHRRPVLPRRVVDGDRRACSWRGWGSNNKYALLSAMRAVNQIISYDLPFIFVGARARCCSRARCSCRTSRRRRTGSRGSSSIR